MTADEYVYRVLDRMPKTMPRRAQIGVELRSHIAERVAGGRRLEDVLRQLGDPVTLAESYLAEVPLAPAPFGRRIAAKLIDIMLPLIGFAIVIFASVAAATTLDAHDLIWMMFPLGIILASISFVLYTVIAEWLSGQTIGKRLFRLRVVRESGARIGLGQSVVRQLPLIFQVFWIDVLFALFTDRRQRAFELLSRTRVIDAAGWDAAERPATTPGPDPGLRPAHEQAGEGR